MRLPDPAAADILEKLERGNQRFAMIEKQLEKIVEKLEPIPQMQRDIAQTRDIVEAWGAIKTIGKGIRWVAGIFTACGAIGAVVWAAIRIGLKNIN